MDLRWRRLKKSKLVKFLLSLRETNHQGTRQVRARRKATVGAALAANCFDVIIVSRGDQHSISILKDCRFILLEHEWDESCCRYFLLRLAGDRSAVGPF